MAARNATAAVIGAGDFIGGAIAKKFASGRLHACSPAGATATSLRPGRRHQGRPAGEVSARSLDARKEEDITAFLQEADRQAPLEVCIFNIGANVNFPFTETTERVFRKVWEMACYSGFLAGREAARLMLPRGKGCDLLHRRDGQHARRGGLCRLRRGQGRACAPLPRQPRASSAPRTSMSRTCVIDSGVDTAWVRERIKEREGAEALAKLSPDRLMRPEARRRGVLGALPAAARRLELGNGNPPLRREMVSHAQSRLPLRFRQPQRLSQPPRHSRHREAAGREVRLRAGPAGRRLQDDRQPLARPRPMPASGTSRSTRSWRPSASSASTASRASSPTRSSRSNTLMIMRGAVAAQKLGIFERYVDEVYRHMWAEPKKLDDPAVLKAALLEIEPASRQAVRAGARPAEIKDGLLAESQRAVERGTFGSPTFFVDDEIYFARDLPARRRGSDRPEPQEIVGSGGATLFGAKAAPLLSAKRSKSART